MVCSEHILKERDIDDKQMGSSKSQIWLSVHDTLTRITFLWNIRSDPKAEFTPFVMVGEVPFMGEHESNGLINTCRFSLHFVKSEALAPLCWSASMTCTPPTPPARSCWWKTTAHTLPSSRYSSCIFGSAAVVISCVKCQGVFNVDQENVSAFELMYEFCLISCFMQINFQVCW